MKIVVAEKISPQAVALLEAEEGWSVVTPERYQADVRAALADADCLIVRSAVQVTPDLLQCASRLRVIGRAGVGVDNVDVEAATRRGIVVMNTPGANAVAVAELTMALMLCLARHVSRADQSTRAGKWEKKALQGTELRGRMLGIVGLGRIGIEVSRRAKAFGMHVIASDPYVSPALAEELGIALYSLDELYAQSDYISMHVGLTPQTSGMLDAAAFGKMKRGVRLVNCARGELIDEAALAEVLRSGHVAGAALDVFVNEPPVGCPVLSLPNVVLTPHLGASTAEAQDAVGVQIASQIPRISASRCGAERRQRAVADRPGIRANGPLSHARAQAGFVPGADVRFASGGDSHPLRRCAATMENRLDPQFTDRRRSATGVARAHQCRQCQCCGGRAGNPAGRADGGRAENEAQRDSRLVARGWGHA